MSKNVEDKNRNKAQEEKKENNDRYFRYQLYK
jgi:hypothetical protein